jgi:hypothetical protein
MLDGRGWVQGHRKAHNSSGAQDRLALGGAKQVEAPAAGMSSLGSGWLLSLKRGTREEGDFAAGMPTVTPSTIVPDSLSKGHSRALAFPVISVLRGRGKGPSPQMSLYLCMETQP